MAQSCFSLSAQMKFFSTKIFYCCSLETSLCCHLEGFDGSGCKGGEKVPLVSQMQRKFGLILYSLGYSSLGQITSWIVASLGQRQNLSSAPSLWEQAWPEEALEAWAASLTCIFLASLEKERPLQPVVERKALDPSANSLI